MSTQSTQLQVIEAVRKSLAAPLPSGLLSPEALAKATFDQSTSPTSGLTAYDLEGPAKMLYPVPTPLRNAIPRVSGKGGIQAAWRAITGVNTAGLRIGVSAGNRGAVQTVSQKDYTASYKGIGLEGNATFEAQYSSQGFDDARGKAQLTTLNALMLGEEKMLLGGNTSLALGQTPTPTVAALGTGGTLAAGTLSVICVALSHDGVVNGSVAGGVQGRIVRTNADGSTDTTGGGAAQPSAAAQVTTSGATSSATVSVQPVVGAMGYAWFWGSPGQEALGSISTINSATITGPATGTQLAASLGSVDASTDALAFDGLLTQALARNSGAYVMVMPTGAAGVGTPLTSDGAGGVVEIDLVLKAMWDNFRLGPDTIWCNSQEAGAISRKIVAGGSNSILRLNLEIKADQLGGGLMVREYLNKYSMQGGTSIAIRVHPNMPAGTILMTSNSIPYPLNDVPNVMQVRERMSYYSIEWPLRTRKYEYGVYADEVLQHFFPPSMSVITNIAAG